MTSPLPLRKDLVLLRVGALFAAIWTGACASTQRVPGPMGRAPSAPASPPLPGATEALVVRHSDPVFVRRPGAPAGFPLTFYRKRERVLPGAWILCGSGGRAELVWPGDASSVILSDDGAMIVGDPGRDEPLVRLRDLTRARLFLTPEDRVELVGGAVLRGDPTEPSGPFVVFRLGPDLLRMINQSKRSARLGFLDETLELHAGETFDLPILSGGTAPRLVDPDRATMEAAGIHLDVLGRLRSEEEAGAVRITAEEAGEVGGLGVRVSLEPGDEVSFIRLAPPRSGSHGSGGANPQSAPQTPEAPDARGGDASPPGGF